METLVDTGNPIGDQVVLAYRESKAKKRKINPCHINHASQIGHPCTRYLVYCRTNYNDRSLPSIDLQMIFDEGNMHEKSFMGDLAKAGLDVAEQQRAFTWPEYEISGRIDGKLYLQRGSLDIPGTLKVVPFEFKSMSPFMYPGINTVKDMETHRYLYMRKYPIQMYSYLMMDNCDYGLFILKNKTSGQIKCIDVPLDYSIMENVLVGVESVNKHIKAKTKPEPLNDPDVCLECPFKFICKPDILNKGLVEGSPGLMSLLNERSDLMKEIKDLKIKDKEKRVKEITENIKKLTQGTPAIIAGRFMIHGKLSVRKGYVVNDSEHWSMKITETES